MSEPKLRAKVRRGLLKVEQLHALARAVYYGQRGRISAREVYWQAREISRLAAAPDFPFDPERLRHVSPIKWKNVVLYGEIKIEPRQAQGARPLTWIIREDGDSGGDTGASVWYKRCAHKRLATTETPA